MDRFDCHNGNTAAYFAQPAERLVLEGYRHWAAGKATGDVRAQEAAVDLYLDILGHRGSKTAIYALSAFIGALGRCAACPLRTFEAGSPHICRDEVMVMGLVAGIQNHDDQAVETCLSALTCRSRCEEVALAAGSFALVLRGLGKVLQPIPAPVISEILHRSAMTSSAAAQSTTLH
ncbi:hypothetical protein [Oricola sp.]|uniref:hypothetical protein n=1 Tax=Oricola sp. TaxID=1979950 RepID=UPI003BAC4519